MDFLSKFQFGEGLLAVSIKSPSNATFHSTIPDIPTNTDVYFGPAMRETAGNEKKNVLGTQVLWVDADDVETPLATLPPSMIVFSGHGWHLYWMLDEPITDVDEIESLNQTVIKDVPTSDPACWNVNRVLRVPGTLNTKDPPANVFLKESFDYTYTIKDIQVLDGLDRAAKHKIRTGDRRGYRSRSERDWAIVTALVAAGATDELINLLFNVQPCGDKVRSDENPRYLEHTLKKARARTPSSIGTGIEHSSDGYYMWSKRGKKRISTFTINPTILLDGSHYGAVDAVVGNVMASGYKWTDTVFSRTAFTSVAKMDRECPVAAWQWLGRDDDLRALLPFLLERLQAKGLPKVAASPTLGMHFLKNKPFFLGDKQVLGAEGYWQGYDGPLAWLPSNREHPNLDLLPEPDDGDFEVLRNFIPKLSDEDSIWVILGWYAASCLKPWLEKKGYRYPILNVVGTKGSGKTTLIQRVFMPLFGQTDPKSYDAGTTRFVTLALLGSSNAVPIAFSEFQYVAVERFLRFVLLSYDTGHDPRGRGDQTTVDYPLSAPFSIDGEDLIEDPAARERIVVAHLHPNTIEEGSEAYQAFNDYRLVAPKHFGGYYVQEALKLIVDGTMDDMLQASREAMFEAFPGRLPDRVRNNHVVAYLGNLLWCRVLDVMPPSPEVHKHSMQSVFDLETGRSRTLVDGLVEDITNAASQGASSFRWAYDEVEVVMWFQLASAHSWWLSSRRRQGRGALERDAIRSQLKEAPYIKDPCMMRDTWMYGIDLQAAQDFGLDIPVRLQTRTFSVNF